MPAVVPMLAYEDAAAAIDWLCAAFGFEERERIVMPDGTIGHAELAFGDGLVTLATPTPDYESPLRHRETCEAARRWLEVPYVIDGVLVHVGDVDAHHERAVQHGATVLSPPADQGGGLRHCRAEDPEGHRWMFAQVAPDAAART